MEIASLGPPPPDRPERPDGVERGPRWPALFALGGFVAGTLGTFLLVGIIAALLGLHADAESPAFVIVGTLAPAIVFVATAVAFASLVAKPQAWHFGLRGTRFWPALGWAALGIVAFYIVSAAYSPLVPEDVEQTVTEDLGADESTLGLISAGVMVMVVAPVAEEFFFRGFFYRALRTRFSVAAAAIIDGLLFGVIHYNFEGAEALLLVPPLALLGVIFCLVYEATGSIFPAIALHSMNNAIAYGATVDDGWRVSLALGPLTIAACILVPRLLRPPARGAPALP